MFTEARVFILLVYNSNMTTEEKVKLITRNCQEVLTEEDLKKLIESGKDIQHYIGFEISGLVHLGTGLMSMGKIADFLKINLKFIDFEFLQFITQTLLFFLLVSFLASPLVKFLFY